MLELNASEEYWKESNHALPGTFFLIGYFSTVKGEGVIFSSSEDTDFDNIFSNGT